MNNKRIAAIDLGTNSFHLLIVELRDVDANSYSLENGINRSFNILYRQREIVRINIGKKINPKFLPEEGIQRALKVLAEFKEKINEFDAEIFAIATSAIREAENRDEFLKLVNDELGIEINVVSGYEEARLIYLGVLQGLNVYNKQILLIDIGGGSTELLIGKRGKVLFVSSLKIGAVRLAQRFFSQSEKFSEDQKKECENFIEQIVVPNIKPIKKIGYDQVIGTSGEIQAIARMIFNEVYDSYNYKPIDNVEFTYKQFEKVSKKIFNAKSLSELKALPALDEKRSEIILPGTLILKVLLEKLNIGRITVSASALREGIIIDALEKIQKKEVINEDLLSENKKRKRNRLRSVIEFAKSFDVDLKHSEQVKKISLQIFDELQTIHKLTDYHRELLEYAAILHDIGYYISPLKHHKHSYNMIKNSELVGFTNEEIELIANITRYHRKALPDDKHKNFASLSEENKKVVKILSAILRISDGLEKTHAALINDIRSIKTKTGEVVLILRYLTHPPDTEIWAAKKRKKVLESVLNIKIDFQLEKLSY